MKHTNSSKKIAVSAVLAITLMFQVAPVMLQVPPVLAEDPAGGATPPVTGSPDDSRKTPNSIPESFNVNTYLTTDGQKSRVPTEAEQKDGKPTGIIKVGLDVIDLFVKLIGSISLIVFMIGALLTIASEGKQDLLGKGKNAMVYAVIGLVVSLFAFIIVAFVQSILF